MRGVPELTTMKTSWLQFRVGETATNLRSRPTRYKVRSLRCEKCNRSIGDTTKPPSKCPFCGGKLR